MLRARTGHVALLLFGSGFCALVYQTTWFREFRLIFGASTAASAAVLAIFMGGLGLGGALLGARADRSRNSLRLYARLEIGIAVTAALTPLLLLLVRGVYIAAGGPATFGAILGTGIRLLLATLVLAIPTILMGGTLPAAARAVESGDDAGRRRLAVLYGTNTLGAVTGALVGTFGMLEIFGNRTTLWIAALLNLLVAVVARSLATRLAPEEERAPVEAQAAEAIADTAPPVPGRFVFAAAALVGFAFFLMEIVWYRMLSPLLGGSTYTFGLILAVALAGIGLGGLLYSTLGMRRPATLLAFAATCGAEALFLAIPYAIGDGVAVFAILLRRLGELGFYGYVGGWTVVTSLVVLPAAIVAGFQFPLLIGLLGRGRENVGRDAGLAYAWNTVGAIAGSLAGGFGILPLLSAIGTWKAVVTLLALLALVALALASRLERARIGVAFPALLVAGALASLAALGPTAVWRHTPIGAGRSDQPESNRSWRDWMNAQRSTIVWDVDGIASTVAITSAAGYAFLVNGKSDGHFRTDAGTQIMAGLMAAAVHPDPRRAFVIGLGTGSTAGWLGRVPSIESVDVAELEPAILQVAELARPVNADMPGNPKVRVHLGDAREILLVSDDRYDVIFSEPSNPYRAGVASLFTRDFYEAVAERLEKGGVFVQWVQMYEIESDTVRTVYATLASVFPHIETWQSQRGDLILLASESAFAHDADALRQRLATEPYRTAMHVAWRTESLEGFLARHVANEEFARLVARESSTLVNTDDRNFMEFEAARSVGRNTAFNIDQLRSAARAVGRTEPRITGTVDWDRVAKERLAIATIAGSTPRPPLDAPPELQARAQAHGEWADGRLAAVLRAWTPEAGSPVNSLEAAMLAEAAADEEHPAAELWIERLAAYKPVEAVAVRARLRWREGRIDEAVDAIVEAFTAHRTDPWPDPDIMRRAHPIAELAAAERPDLAPRIYEALSQPYAVSMLDAVRRLTALSVARRFPEGACNPSVIATLETFEPWPPWRRDHLDMRAECYSRTDHPLAAEAARDLLELLADQPAPFLDTRERAGTMRRGPTAEPPPAGKGTD